ncbi:unnamed protein product [Linum trigynum]|uniref:Helitron helicase-like domain-containing protein n=1 Tax=Linum trigynum TaxID=586398 RepID=A0AAV2E7N7_9ROSI
MLDDCNILVMSFRRIRTELQDPRNNDLRLRIVGSKERFGVQYELRTMDEVVGLIPGDFSVDKDDHDIIVDHRSNGLQRISSLHPKFEALHFPLLFPYGEDGFHLRMSYRTTHRSTSTKRKHVTQREYYYIRLQFRVSEGHTLLRGGTTFQHYYVDAFATIEQNRLTFLRYHQKQLRTELYKGLHDAFSKGDLDAKHLGSVILPATYIGSLRYMKQLYLDAMAICQYFGNPDLFIAFTCNAQCPEITDAFSSVLGSKGDEKPQIIARVFNMKLKILKEYIHKSCCFGRSVAGVALYFIMPF